MEQCFVIITSELIDPEEAVSILTDPEVYDRIKDDEFPEEPPTDRNVWPPPESIYYGGFVDGELASVSIVHPTENGGQFHFQVLKPYREHKRELLRQALEYYRDWNLWCEIPDLYPGVLKLAKEFGFREVEVLSDHYVKNGQRYDSRILEL